MSSVIFSFLCSTFFPFFLFSDIYRPRIGGSVSGEQDNISVTDGVELDKSSVHSGSQPIDTAMDALAELGGGGEGPPGSWNNLASESDTASLSEVKVMFLFFFN